MTGRGGLVMHGPACATFEVLRDSAQAMVRDADGIRRQPLFHLFNEQRRSPVHDVVPIDAVILINPVYQVADPIDFTGDRIEPVSHRGSP